MGRPNSDGQPRRPQPKFLGARPATECKDVRLCCIGEQLEDLLTTLGRLNATEMIRAADAAGLRSSLTTDNITVFAPVNAAFDALHQPTTVEQHQQVAIQLYC